MLWVVRFNEKILRGGFHVISANNGLRSVMFIDLMIACKSGRAVELRNLIISPGQENMVQFNRFLSALLDVNGTHFSFQGL